MIKIQNNNVGIFTNGLNSPEYVINGDTITVSSGAKTDFFNAPDGSSCSYNAPLLLKEIDNTVPFTFSVRVKPVFHDTYDAGAVYLFHNEMHWQKFAFEMDERKLTRLVTVRTLGTSDDNNHDAVTVDAVFMKISSDTKNLGFYYSVGGNEWQLARLYRNDFPEKIYIGISSQSPIGGGIKTSFSDVEFVEKSVVDFRMGM